MNRIARYATLLVVLAAGLLVACGGDESEERPAAEAAPERFVNEFPRSTSGSPTCAPT